jgi:glycosyltransferase involved in cell wall biosynthesis
MVYSALEGAEGWQVQGMQAQCDALYVIPVGIDFPRPGLRGNNLDDWYDPAVGRKVRRLCSNFKFDFALIHYVWMSAVCNDLPEDLPTFLFTHDRFGERHEMLARSGIAPTWYSISCVDEAVGLARADRIIATQEDEAKYFRSIMTRPVDVLGSIQALRTRPPRIFDESGLLKAGYLGSANPGNCLSLRLLLEAIDKDKQLCASNFELVLAGPISRVPEMMRPYIVTLDEVESIDELFRVTDVILNPSVGGSGLKIKTVESLAAGMPLVSTLDGMMGLPVTHPALGCIDQNQLVAELSALIEPKNMIELAGACRVSIEAYCAEQVSAFNDLFSVDRITQFAVSKQDVSV